MAAAAAIRLLAAPDMEAYRALRLAGLSAHPTAFGGDAEEEAAWPLSDWLARLQQRATLGAFAEAGLVGTAALAIAAGRKNRHRGHLVGMVVAPPARRLGIGRALVEAVIGLAGGQVERLCLAVAIDNGAAIALYRACGFQPYGVEPDALRVNGQSVDELLMQRLV